MFANASNWRSVGLLASKLKWDLVMEYPDASRPGNAHLRNAVMLVIPTMLILVILFLVSLGNS
jgi:hypothetical protein